MLKVRAMGDMEDIKWFQETLAKSQVVDLIDFSDIFPCANTRKYYRAYGQVEKKQKYINESIYSGRTTAGCISGPAGFGRQIFDGSDRSDG